MHRMPNFVSQRIHAVPFVLKVQQDKRASLIPAATICPTTLPWRLVDIDPPFFKRLFKSTRIFLTQWSKGSHYCITCLREAYLISSFLYNRHIEIGRAH